jgi:hypothetical protein
MSTTTVVPIISSMANPAGAGFQRPLFVLFTSPDRTLKALQRARELAEPIGGRVVILATQIVPYQLPLDEATVPMEFVLKRFAETAAQLYPHISIVGYLCRDRMEALKQILSPNSPVLIGIRKRWWKTQDEKLADTLRGAGFAVLQIDAE